MHMYIFIYTYMSSCIFVKYSRRGCHRPSKPFRRGLDSPLGDQGQKECAANPRTKI